MRDIEIPKTRCEKIGPMQWRIHAPGRPPFDYWVYSLVVDGVTHTETFETEHIPTETP